MNVFELQLTAYLIVYLLILAVSIFAFVNSLFYSAQAYEAADKLTKPTWCAILGFGVILQLIAITANFAGILSIVLLIAALVYLADVRPALAGLRRR